MRTLNSSKVREFVSCGMIMLSCFALPLLAQTGSPYGSYYAGDKSVYPTQPNLPTNSHAYIDAYAAISNNLGLSQDVCTAIQTSLTNLAVYSNYTGEGAVIDARGVLPPSGQTWQLCNTTANLWQGSSNYPVTVLLPAGTILLLSSWKLPSGTKIVGEGIGGAGQGTTIQACSSTTTGCSTSFSGTFMVQLGIAAGCTGVSVENLTLDGNGVGTNPQVVSGITNSNCGDLSYVDHVWLYRMMGTGLSILLGAEHSGPYSNITFDTFDATAVKTTTMCANITASYIHGLRQVFCSINQPASSAATAISVSGSSTNVVQGVTLEDIRIEGYEDGIVIGPYAQSIVLRNIDGDSNTDNTAPTVDVIEISDCTGVSDVAMLGIGNIGTSSNGQHNYTISEACTSPNLTNLTDASVAMYILGRPSPSAGGFSRFTTSPNTASWSSGVGAPSSSTQPCKRGSLYSNMSPSASSPAAFWVCTLNNSNPQWLAPAGQ